MPWKQAVAASSVHKVIFTPSRLATETFVNGGKFSVKMRPYLVQRRTPPIGASLSGDVLADTVPTEDAASGMTRSEDR